MSVGLKATEMAVEELGFPGILQQPGKFLLFKGHATPSNATAVQLFLQCLDAHRHWLGQLHRAHAHCWPHAGACIRMNGVAQSSIPSARDMCAFMCRRGRSVLPGRSLKRLGKEEEARSCVVSILRVEMLLQQTISIRNVTATDNSAKVTHPGPPPHKNLTPTTNKPHAQSTSPHRSVGVDQRPWRRAHTLTLPMSCSRVVCQTTVQAHTVLEHNIYLIPEDSCPCKTNFRPEAERPTNLASEELTLLPVA